MTKRVSDTKLGLPNAKRAKTALAQWNASLIDHAAKSDELGGIQVKWSSLYSSNPFEHGEAPRFPKSDIRAAMTSHAHSDSHSGDHAPSHPPCEECATMAFRRTSPSVYVGSQDRWFASLGEAVEHARAGDVITLQPGRYVQTTPIVLAHDGVKIIAAGCDDVDTVVREASSLVTVVSHTQGQDCLVCLAAGCEIRGISFVHSSCSSAPKDADEERAPNSALPPHSSGCIQCESGDMRLIQCTITSWSGYGIKVVGSSKPLIESCTLSQCQQVAVLLMGTSSATLRGCYLNYNMCAGIVMLDTSSGDLCGNTIAHNEKCGIVCAGRSSARVFGNAVLGGNGGGVWIRECSTVSLVENLIALSLKVSVQVSDESCPTVHKNRITNGCNGGIVVHGSARGLFTSNIITGHNKAGLGVTDSARARFVGNSLCNNRAGGAIFTGQSYTEWEDNMVDDNLLFGMHVRGNASVHAQSGSASLNCGPGLQLQESGHAQLLGVSLDGNKRSGAIAVGNATLKMCSCHLRATAPQHPASDTNHKPNNAPATSRNASTTAAAAEGGAGGAEAAGNADKTQRIGVQVAGDARVDILSSCIQGHGSGNVVVQGRSSCTIKDTSITSGSWAGIVLQGTSQTVMRRVHIGHVRSAGVLCMDQAMLTAEGSEFSDCKGVGLLMAGSSRALLIRNAIVGNAGTGLMIKELACVDMRKNRISSNGLDGVTLEGACVVTASENAIFENEGAGMHSMATDPSSCAAAQYWSEPTAVPELIAFANILVSSKNLASVAVAIDGPIAGIMCGNMLDSWQTTPHEDTGRKNSDDNDDDDAPIYGQAHAQDEAQDGPSSQDATVHHDSSTSQVLTSTGETAQEPANGGMAEAAENGGRAEVAAKGTIAFLLSDTSSTEHRVQGRLDGGTGVMQQGVRQALNTQVEQMLGEQFEAFSAATLTHSSALREHQPLSHNATVERGELAALLRNELLPLDCYGPAAQKQAQLVAMPDGSTALACCLSSS